MIAVLDKGFVELFGIPSGADQSIVAAARTSKYGTNKGDEQDKALLMYLISHEHYSPFELASMTFRVYAPGVVFDQWVRHTSWRFNAGSGRAHQFERKDFYVPTVWRLQDTKNKQGSYGALDPDDNESLQWRLNAVINLSYEYYIEAIRLGVSKEQARLLLPAKAQYIPFVAHARVRDVMFFLKQRLSPDAQWEIRQYALAVYGLLADSFPWCAEAFLTHIATDQIREIVGTKRTDYGNYRRD